MNIPIIALKSTLVTYVQYITQDNCIPRAPANFAFCPQNTTLYLCHDHELSSYKTLDTIKNTKGEPFMSCNVYVFHSHIRTVCDLFKCSKSKQKYTDNKYIICVYIYKA